jgi:SAM-dependent methyltransferase
MELLETDSAAYRAAFELSLGKGSGGAPLRERLDLLCDGLARRVAVDWGAGGGRATALLCERFDRVYAVEPSATMRATIADVAPASKVVDGTLATAEIPEPVDLGLVNHVLYHVPEDEWGTQVMACAERLSDRGVLCVAMKHPDAGCGAMMEHFGAPRFDLYSLLRTFRGQTTFTLEYVRAPGRLEMTSFEETVTVARFVLSDRPPEAFAQLPSEAQFRAYVRTHLWDEARGRGGWDNPKLYAIVRRSRFG